MQLYNVNKMIWQMDKFRMEVDLFKELFRELVNMFVEYL